jgi:hypothetical protein
MKKKAYTKAILADGVSKNLLMLSNQESTCGKPQRIKVGD